MKSVRSEDSKSGSYHLRNLGEIEIYDLHLQFAVGDDPTSIDIGFGTLHTFRVVHNHWSSSTEAHTIVTKGNPVRCYGDSRGLVPIEDVTRSDRAKDLCEVHEFGFFC